MADFFFNYYLMPFHLSVVALILLSVVETIGMYVGLRPSQLLKKIAPVWLTNSPLLNVKFSKALIFVFLLINFSFAGYFLQLSFFAIQHYFITPFYLIIPALVIAIFFTVFMIHCLDQVIKPKLTHTNYNLLGRLATISSGSARIHCGHGKLEPRKINHAFRNHQRVSLMWEELSPAICSAT
ncbi:hypothetical protein ABD1_19460 [Acinetobacter baumannii D1279779]|nr:hypothetical protein ABD1_19460 [Acinetobacter baumannii D1279779]